MRVRSGIDLIVIYNSGRHQRTSRGSLARLMPIKSLPLAMPEDPEYVLKNTNSCHYFYGGSSMKHLPTEIALKQRSRNFKPLVAKRKARQPQDLAINSKTSRQKAHKFLIAVVLAVEES